MTIKTIDDLIQAIEKYLKDEPGFSDLNYWNINICDNCELEVVDVLKDILSNAKELKKNMRNENKNN